MSYIGKQPTKAPLTASDIEDGIITAAKIEDGAVVAAEIASNAVTTAKINADAVTGAKIADDAINSEHYTDGSIDTAHIADLNVTSGKIAADAITAAKIADDAISEEHLDATVITGMTELAATPADTDEFLISDAGTLKRIDYSHIKGGGGSDGFHAYDMSGGNASGNLVLTSEIFDDGGNYSTSNGKYTAPSDGKYFFYASTISTGSSGSVYFAIDNGDPPGGTDHAGNTANTSTQGTVFITLDLTANQTVNLKTAVTVYNNYCFFGGFKIY